MFQQILTMDNLIFYILAVEVFFLFLAQLRTNGLLKKTLKLRTHKKETVKQLKEEVKKGKSDIPVVKFEKEKPVAAPEKKTEKKAAKANGMDQKELAVLQEMMAEFFG